MWSLLLAVAFFALAAADFWGQRDVWLMWGVVNLTIGGIFIVSGAIRARR